MAYQKAKVLRLENERYFLFVLIDSADNCNAFPLIEFYTVVICVNLSGLPWSTVDKKCAWSLTMYSYTVLY